MRTGRLSAGVFRPLSLMSLHWSLMAQVNGIPLADRESRYPSGALFLLTQPTKASILMQPEAGTEVELRQGSSLVVARCCQNDSAEGTFDRAHETAQRALDIVAAMGQRPMQIVDAYSEVLLWWREGSRQILRVISVLPTGIEISLSVTVTGADGQAGRCAVGLRIPGHP